MVEQIDIKNNFQCEYTHNDYRRAKVAQMIDLYHVERFYYQGKEITKSMADNITTKYMIKKFNS